LQTTDHKPAFPPGINHAFWFVVYNALSFQIVLGSPMVLYGKSLGASATVLGIIAGMMPLLVIFQIPAASHVSRVGYKKFVLGGWTIRVAFIFGMMLVPLTSGFLPAQARLALLLFLLFCFNLSRGISSCAWLPWLSALIPDSLRGRYLAREAVCLHAASLVALLLAGAVLGSEPRAWQFAVIFAFSAITGAISLNHLKAMPEASGPEPFNQNPNPVPWKEIYLHAPFNKLLWFNVAWALAYGGLNTFTVAYLKVEAGLSTGTILMLTALSFLGGLIGLWFFEARVDRFGSKPVVLVCLIGWVVIAAGWFCLAARGVTATLTVVLLLELAMGLGFALVNMNNTRLAMVLTPAMGRNHFFALFSVVQNLSLGLAPIGWGMFIDAIGQHRLGAAGWELNRYSAFFLAVMLVFVAAFVLCRRLDEPKARPLEELLRELLVDSPLRFRVRLWPRG
jgi:MFS family permease